MSPVEKAEISRRNGQLSHGPVSAEGKQAVSRNAVKHGFASMTIAIKNDERAKYAETLQIWIDDLRPNSPVELTLVERVCRNSWKLSRIAGREDELIDNRLAIVDGLDDEAIAAIERELKLLNRYEQAAERNFHKALGAFMNLRKNPELLAANTPAPAPVPQPAPPPRVETPAAPLVIPPVPNKPSLIDDLTSLFGDFNPVLNVSAARPPVANGKTHRADVR